MSNYIYVPGLSESVEVEIKKENAAKAPKHITTTGAKKKEAVTLDRGVQRAKKVDDRDIHIPVWEKYALTIKEAAGYYNISEYRLKDFVTENRTEVFVLKAGARFLIKRKLFEAFLDENDTI